MRKLFLMALVIFSLTEMDAYSKKIILTNDLTISVPQSMQRDTTNAYLYCAYDSALFLAVSTVETSDFHSWEVLKSMEEHSFHMKQVGLQCYKEESDKFYEWNKDYVKKFYKSDNADIMTYTFYTADRPYSILFMCKGDAELKEAEAIINSIDYGGNLWKQITLTFKRAAPFWVLFFVVIYPAICLGCTMLINRKEDDVKVRRSYVWSVICATPILFVTLWGSWLALVCYLIITILACVPCFIIGMVGMQKILGIEDKSSNNKNYDSGGDYDGGSTEFADIVGL